MACNLSVSTLITYALSGAVVFFMVASSLSSQHMQATYHYSKPYFIVYATTSALSVMYPLLYIRCLIKARYANYVHLVEGQEDHHHHVDNHHHQRSGRSSSSSPSSRISLSCSNFLAYLESLTVGFSLRRVFVIAIPFSITWMISNYFFTLALRHTDTASALAIEQVATVFIFILSIIFLKMTIHWKKCLSLLICIGGVMMVAIGDSLMMENDNSNDKDDVDAPNRLLGDIFVVTCAAAAACYMVFFAKFMGDHIQSLESVCVWLGTIGVIVCLTMWPILIIFHFTNFELFELPHSTESIILFIIHIICAGFFNYLLNYGIMRVSPLYMRVVTICSLPVSFLLSYFAFNVKFLWWNVFGIILVLIGFTAYSVFELKINRSTDSDARLATSGDEHARIGSEMDGTSR
eukprot:TRINITY_DN5810_c0_g2_i1.p1 TRINITY_DN5810_c0_g2~~TRINITY_DN5810_c0_g2_i1.p1  ORF type:complete len:423 (-),score=56.28 TRINITY_DN5810_c0_g2_i1:14-1231(-)